MSMWDREHRRSRFAIYVVWAMVAAVLQHDNRAAKIDDVHLNPVEP